MSIDRRGFIKLAGLTTLAGVVGNKAISAFADELAVPAPDIKRGLIGKRWAMIVNLKKCTEQEGCTDCIAACHSVHNVPHFPNPKDEIKWIWKEPFDNAFLEQEHEYIDDEIKQGPAIVLCNHCDNPPCVRVCPTKATFKREDGIVAMDMHRCIGCRYCVAACPYGSRSFNWRDPRPFIEKINPDFPTRMRGVVEKCNFCTERLARGQMPACVEACKENCLVFGDLEDPNSPVRELLRSNFSIRRKPSLGTNPQVYYIV
jgi:Fe-S-cluster-containing dehydrogenase component